MNKIIQNIIDNKTTCIFVSPHLDDVAFSAGGLLSYLSGKVPLIVINVFTHADSLDSLSAKAYLHQCGVTSAVQLFLQRGLEDHKALSTLDCSVINLPYVDALWRQKPHLPWIVKKIQRIIPELALVYPLYRKDVVSGKASNADSRIFTSLAHDLAQIIPEGKVAVFCPSAIGGHVDHVLVKEVCTKMFPGKINYWLDQPYAQTSLDKRQFLSDPSYEPYILDLSDESKWKLSKLYTSQYKPVLYDNHAVNLQETFYLPVQKNSKYTVTVELVPSKKLLERWRILWQITSHQSLTNSSDWFIACCDTFKYPKSFVLACWQEENLVGVLPVVTTKKFGLSVLASPGNQFLDRSTLLVNNDQPGIIYSLFSKLTELGDWYLGELPQWVVNISTPYLPQAEVKTSSLSPFVPLSDNPLRFLSSKNRRRYESIISESEVVLTDPLPINGLSGTLSIVRSIEKESSKKSECKEIFDNPQVTKLLSRLYELNPGNIFIRLLKYRNQNICYHVGFVYGRTFAGFATGFCNTFRYLMPGKISFLLMLNELYRLGFTTLDLSRGDGRYKSELTPFINQQYSMFYSSNNLKKIWWSFCLNALACLDNRPALYELIRISKNRLFPGKSI